MAEQQLRDKIILDCSDNSFHCFGYSYLFDKRAQRFRKKIKLLQVFGIAIPATVGATAVGYGYNNEILKFVLFLAAPLLIIQFTISIIAIIYEWDTELSYAFEATQDYDNLYDKFKKLYGDWVGDKWTDVEMTVSKRNDPKVKESTVTVTSIGASTVSQHYDLIICDDLVNRESITTEDQLEKVITYYKDLQP